MAISRMDLVERMDEFMKHLRRTIYIFIAFVLVVTSSFVAVTDTADAAAPAPYMLSRSSVKLVKGQKVDLFLYSTDQNSIKAIDEHAAMQCDTFYWIQNVNGGVRAVSCAKYKGLAWKSSKPKVAAVTANGTIKAKKAGKARITVNYEGRSYTCTVKVYKSLSKKQREKMAKQEAKRIVNTYTNSSMTGMQKARALAYYMFINTGLQEDQSTRSYKKNYGNEAYAALVMHLSACSGYCKAYKMLCDAAGIKCKHVNANKWTHQWNEVYIDGKWLIVDTQAGMFDLPEDESLMAKTFDKTHMGPIYRKTKTFDDGYERVKCYI